MALPVDFDVPLHDDVKKVTYRHPDCLDLPSAVIRNTLGQIERVDVMAHVQSKLDEQETIDVVSAWQLHPAELQHCIDNGGIVYIRVVGGQPPISITGYNPLLYHLITDPADETLD